MKLRYALTQIRGQHFVILALILFFLYIAVQVFSFWFTQPVKGGYIQDGYEVDYETEKRLTEQSLAQAAKSNQMYVNSQTLDTLFYCIGIATDMKMYDCVANLMSDELKAQFNNGTNEDLGKVIYDSLVKERVLTGINKVVKEDKFEKSVYEVEMMFLDGSKEFFELTIQRGTITNLRGLTVI